MRSDSFYSRSSPREHVIDSSEGVQLLVKSWPVQKALSDAEDPFKPIAVLVHQYSLLGGKQALMEGLAVELNKLHFWCVTFDMRGAGKSSGRMTLTGQAEVQDVVAVCKWAAKSFGRKVLLIGSSAGAPIAGSALDAAAAAYAFIGIGYTFGRLSSFLFGGHYHKIIQSAKPKLFIMGTKDGFTSVRQLKSVVKKCKGIAELHLVEGKGHFELESSAYDPYMADLIASFEARNGAPPWHLSSSSS